MTTYAARIILSAPIAYWRLGEAAGVGVGVDEMDNHALTYGTGVTLEQSGALIADSDDAALFSGADGTGARTSGALFPVATNTPWSVDLWLKYDYHASSASPVNQYIYPDTNRAQIIFVSTATKRMGFWHAGSTLVSSDTDFPDGTWVHAALTCSATGDLRLYQGGVEVDESIGGFAGKIFSNRVVTLGARDGAGGAPNSIDDIAIYDRELTAAEVADHHTWGTIGVPADGLVGLSLETNQAFSATPRHILPILQAVESDSALNIAAGGGVGVVAEGMQFTIPENRLHYTLPESKIHYTHH